MLSLSILHESPGLIHFRRRLAEIEPVNLGVIYGCASVRMDGLIHAISAAQQVFGGGVQTVQVMGNSDDVEFVKLDYGNQPGKPAGGGLLTQRGGGGGSATFSFYAAAIGRHGASQSEPQNDYTHPWGMRRIVEKMRVMVRTGRSPVPMNEMLENIAVADAVRKAHRTGKVVRVEPTEDD